VSEVRILSGPPKNTQVSALCCGSVEPVQVRQLELLAADGVPVRDGRVDLRAVGWPSAPQEQLP
jgi:hypothetical protein